MTGRPPEGGVILVNVLVALALGAALVLLMLTSQDSLLDRARRASAASQAEALARGAETSAIVALRRDMDEAPEADHYAEPWAAVAQEEVTLGTGQFEVAVSDVQARLDLGSLARGGIVQAEAFGRLLAALDLPPEVGPVIAGAMAGPRPPASLGGIPGLDAAARARLAPYVDVLPVPGDVNLSTADPLLVEVLVQSPVAAARLVALRDRQGFLTPADVAEAGVVAAPGTGFTSDVFDVRVRAEVDGVTAELRSRLVRRRGVGTREVVVAARRFGPAAAAIPDPAPF